MSTAIEGVSGTGLEAQSSQTDAVKSLIRWESPHPLSIAGVKTNKKDAADAEACCEAVQRPGMRFVPVKSREQQAAMALHRVRDHLVRQRTGTINALRGHLAEYGIIAAALRGGLNQLIAIVEAEDDDEYLPASVKQLLRMLVAEIRAADARIAELDRKLKDHARNDEACRRLIEGRGVG